MSSYPDVITPEVLQGLAHISDDTMQQDIVDTEAEIANKRIEREGHDLIAKSVQDRSAARLAEWKRDGCDVGIDDSVRFVKFLAKLLDARENGLEANGK